jgi:hypothetical protein
MSSYHRMLYSPSKIMKRKAVTEVVVFLCCVCIVVLFFRIKWESVTQTVH